MAMPVEDILKAEGLMLAPLINGDWICGRGSRIYSLKVTSDHYADPSLGIGKTAREAIAAALKKGLGKSSEMWGT